MAGIKNQPSPKPANVPSPVPGDSQQSAFDSAETGMAQSAGKGASAFDSANTGAAPQDQSASQSPGLASQTLDAAGRVLDYPGGFMRAGLASAGGLVTGQGEIVKPEDLANAAVGKGPNSAEYLKRLGVSEGGSMTLPGLGRVTVRGAEGLALDVLTDPLTLVAKTVKQIPYLQKLLEVPGKASEAMGEAIYKSAITAKSADAAKTAGEAMIEQGAPMAGQAGLDAKIADAAKTMGGLRQGLYDKFTEMGGKIDMPSDAFKNADGVLAKLRDNPTLRPLADELENMVKSYQGEGFVTMDQMSRWKTQLYDSLPKNAFNGAKLSNPAKMFKSALANDFKNLIVDSGNSVEKGLGDAINTINDKWGALLESEAVSGPGNGSLGKMIDGAAFAVGGLPAYIKKKAFDVAAGPYGRTLAGNALMQAGKTGLADKMARQAIIKPGQQSGDGQ